MDCASCGATLMPEAKYCHACGASVAESDSASLPPSDAEYAAAVERRDRGFRMVVIIALLHISILLTFGRGTFTGFTVVLVLFGAGYYLIRLEW